MGEIKAFYIDTSRIYFLVNDTFYVKSFDLITIDYFIFPKPKIKNTHDIDFDTENHSNLYYLDNYFVLLFYSVDVDENGIEMYNSTNKKFYFFNKDTSFFSGIDCLEDNLKFHYFRYPAIGCDKTCIYHANRTSNCLMKYNIIDSYHSIQIDSIRNNYLTITNLDQFEISKLKKYRFSSDYNKELVIKDSFIYLFIEIPSHIYFENKIRKYDHELEIKKYNKNLQFISEYRIKNKNYSYSLILDNRLYLFYFKQEKAFIYEI